jgi:DNA repair exonuclease SbcCD ATPase subunit
MSIVGKPDPLGGHPHFNSTPQLIEELAKARAEAAHWKDRYTGDRELRTEILALIGQANEAHRMAQEAGGTSHQQTEVIEQYKLTTKSLLEDLARARAEIERAREDRNAWEDAANYAQKERERLKALLRETFEARTEVGDCQLSHLIRGMWPDLWDKITKELEK